jgi:type I restriction enzyme M protein
MDQNPASGEFGLSTSTERALYVKRLDELETAENFEPRDMYVVVHVFPWRRTPGGNGTTYSKHMEGARFTIPTPALLAKVVDMIDKVPMEDRDTKGDLYEYMLGKIATAGQNGQFRTPRHIIRLMVEMVQPKPTDLSAIRPAGRADSWWL